MYISVLNNQIEALQLSNQNKEQLIASQGNEIDWLNDSIALANHATKAALYEVEQRELIAQQRLTKITQLNSQLSQFKLKLNALEHTDEHVQSWATEPVPAAVVSLLNHTRANSEDSNRGASAEATATTTTHASLSYASHDSDYQPRLGDPDWRAISSARNLRF
nr:hypothetical protein [Neiella marina]